MAAVPYPSTPGPDGASALIQRLSRPGVCSAQIEWFGPTEAFIVPQNNRRVYLSFSIETLLSKIIVTPGDTDTDCGFVLHNSHSIQEFGGALLSPLIRSEWKGTPDGPAKLNITVINSG